MAQRQLKLGKHCNLMLEISIDLIKWALNIPPVKQNGTFALGDCHR